MLSLRQQIEEKSEGLCNIGPGPGGIGVSNPPGSEVYMLLMFEPKPVQDGVVFPESVDGYSVRIAGFDAETDRELTKKELEQLLKEDQNPTTQKIAGTILALSEPQYISTEECVNAFRIMADEETQEMCEKPQTGMNGPVM